MSQGIEHQAPLTGALRRTAMRNIDEIFSAALRLVQEGEAAEDLVVRAFEEYKRHPGKWQHEEDFPVCIYRLMLESAFPKGRQKESPVFQAHDDVIDSITPFFISDELLNKYPTLDSRSLASMVEGLSGENIQRALSLLPAQFRSAVVLCDFQGLTVADASESLNMPIESTRSVLLRGRRLFHHALWDEYFKPAGEKMEGPK